MADTSIEWTDATWNPVAGCSVISPGCTNCYAMRMGARREGADEKRAEHAALHFNYRALFSTSQRDAERREVLSRFVVL